jgi:hypothetical protein
VKNKKNLFVVFQYFNEILLAGKRVGVWGGGFETHPQFINPPGAFLYRYATINDTKTSQRYKNANRKKTPPGQSEVGNLDATLVRHEEIGNLQVPVYDEV